jgi:hypothetical protein
MYFLCKYNAKSANIRGRQSVNAYAYTITLFLGFGFLGMVAAIYSFILTKKPGETLSDAYVTLITWLFGALGASMSILLSKRGDLEGLKQNQLTIHEISLINLSALLDTPCHITITREPGSYDESYNPIYVQVNGQFVGIVNSEQTVYFTTNRQLNIMTGGNSQNLRLPSSCSFTASPGGQVFISIRGTNIAQEPTTVPTV